MKKLLNYLIARLFKSKISDPESAVTAVIRFASEMIKPNLPKILISLFFMIIASIATAGLAFLIKPAMNKVLQPSALQNIYWIGFAVMGVSLVKGIAQYIYSVIISVVGLDVIAQARFNLFKTFVQQDMYFYSKHKPGELVSVIMNDVNQMSGLATEVPINIGRDFFSFVGLVAVMFIQNAVYALFVFASFFFVIYPISLSSGKIKKYFIRSQFGFGTLTSHLEQAFNGIRVIKSYNMENKEIKNVSGIIQDIVKIQKKIERSKNVLSPFMEFLGGVCIGAFLIYGGFKIFKGEEDPGTLFSFIGALMLAYQPVKRLSEIFFKVQFGIIAARRYYHFLDYQPELIEKIGAKELNITEATISFKNVAFTYDKKVDVLAKINLKILKGNKIALVGRSGGGKSTIINLMSRFYDVTQGSILINSKDIREYRVKSLRDNISIVSQEVILFDDTIYNNIAYSKYNPTEEEVFLAAKNSYSSEFIETFEQKYDTPIGVRGTKLSGGQRQRISIARAMLKNSPILLLDEATSALDTESERKIQQALDKLMQGKTTLIIAHRLSTIINADYIYVIDKGRVLEEGTHDTLMKDQGFYQYLYNLQFKQQEIL